MGRLKKMRMAALATISSIDRRRSSGYSSTVQTVIAFAQSNAITKPGPSTLLAIDQFIRRRVADGSLALMDALWILGLNSASLQEFASLNYKNPNNHRITYSGASIYGVEGLTPNGIDSYADVNYNPSTQAVNFAQNSASRGLWVYTAPTVGTMMDGYTVSNANRSSNANGVANRINAGANLAVAVDFTGTGYKGLNRSGANDAQFYNELVKSDRTIASTTIPNEKLLLGRSTTSYSDTKISMYFVGGSLTETQHNNIRNDFRTFIQTVF